MPAPSEAEIENALGQRLAAMHGVLFGDFTIAWPNTDVNPDRPFLHFQHVPISRTDNTLDGAGEMATGYITVTVVAERGNHSTPASDLAWKVMSQFPYGLRLTAGNGTITINKPAEALPGYRDGGDWRKPVRINYVAEQS